MFIHDRKATVVHLQNPENYSNLKVEKCVNPQDEVLRGRKVDN